MAEHTEIGSVLLAHMHEPASSFSVGSFGAIAEFHRAADEGLAIDEPAWRAVATGRGALAVGPLDGVRPFAYEILSPNPARWQHGVLFCVPAARAASARRAALTELGPDTAAVRAEDRGAVLFDMGLGSANIDFCVRTEDAALIAALRRAAGRSVLDPESRVMGVVLEASPHRVARSRLARIEVYQPIGRTATPEGPHTHLLPDLLKGGRTHSANIPVPAGLMPGLSLYPASPVLDPLGREVPFDRAALEAFAALLDRWGLPEYRREKARAIAAVRAGRAAESYAGPRTRTGRAALRIALRQLRQTEPEDARVRAWSARFDPGGRAAPPV